MYPRSAYFSDWQMGQTKRNVYPWSGKTPPANTEANRYAEELAKWLDSIEWDLFFTFTHRAGSLSLPAWRRAMGRFYSDVGPARLYWATEAGKVTGRTHIHGLMGGAQNPVFGSPTCEQIFNYGTKYFGRSRVEIFEPKKGAAKYCGKYVTKQNHDYDYFGQSTY